MEPENVENQWPTMTAEKGEFIVGKCERVMDCVIADRGVLQRKAQMLLGLIGGVVTLAVGVWLDPDRNLPAVLERALGVEIVILLAIGILVICKCLAPTDYAAPGGEPDEMLRPDYANQEKPWLLLGYCFMVQDAIAANLNANRRISFWIRVAAIGLFTSPLVAHVIGQFTSASSQSRVQYSIPALMSRGERCCGASSCSAAQYLQAASVCLEPVKRASIGSRLAASAVVSGHSYFLANDPDQRPR